MISRVNDVHCVRVSNKFQMHCFDGEGQKFTSMKTLNLQLNKSSTEEGTDGHHTSSRH